MNCERAIKTLRDHLVVNVYMDNCRNAIAKRSFRDRLSRAIARTQPCRDRLFGGNSTRLTFPPPSKFATSIEAMCRLAFGALEARDNGSRVHAFFVFDLQAGETRRLRIIISRSSPINPSNVYATLEHRVQHFVCIPKTP